MDQIKIGSFLKELRKERNMTQEQIAEIFHVSNRAISRWETGSNMPDISMLVEIAEFYDVSIPEIIYGERKEKMNQETKEAAKALANYSEQKERVSKKKTIGYLLCLFGIFIIISALIVFPSESSWSSIYACFGSLVLLIGIYFISKAIILKTRQRIIILLISFVLLFTSFSLADYISIRYFNQIPRFRLTTTYHSDYPDQLLYQKLFYKVVVKNVGTSKQETIIIK